ncbi:uncharacterized protein [Leptinotarsa decemlineata]|uniref:uncharacterized protein n=1 Tax=Leptinotarsa decemlineata TaxID=7539 RepID=UPI003D306FF7
MKTVLLVICISNAVCFETFDEPKDAVKVIGRKVESADEIINAVLKEKENVAENISHMRNSNIEDPSQKKNGKTSVQLGEHVVINRKRNSGAHKYIANSLSLTSTGPKTMNSVIERKNEHNSKSSSSKRSGVSNNHQQGKTETNNETSVINIVSRNQGTERRMDQPKKLSRVGNRGPPTPTRKLASSKNYQENKTKKVDSVLAGSEHKLAINLLNTNFPVARDTSGHNTTNEVIKGTSATKPIQKAEAEETDQKILKAIPMKGNTLTETELEKDKVKSGHNSTRRKVKQPEAKYNIQRKRIEMNSKRTLENIGAMELNPKSDSNLRRVDYFAPSTDLNLQKALEVVTGKKAAKINPMIFVGEPIMVEQVLKPFDDMTLKITGSENHQKDMSHRAMKNSTKSIPVMSRSDLKHVTMEKTKDVVSVPGARNSNRHNTTKKIIKKSGTTEPIQKHETGGIDPRILKGAFDLESIIHAKGQKLTESELEKDVWTVTERSNFDSTTRKIKRPEVSNNIQRKMIEKKLNTSADSARREKSNPLVGDKSSGSPPRSEVKDSASSKNNEMNKSAFDLQKALEAVTGEMAPKINPMMLVGEAIIVEQVLKPFNDMTGVLNDSGDHKNGMSHRAMRTSTKPIPVINMNDLKRKTKVEKCNIDLEVRCKQDKFIPISTSSECVF